MVTVTLVHFFVSAQVRNHGEMTTAAINIACIRCKIVSNQMMVLWFVDVTYAFRQYDYTYGSAKNLVE